MDITLITGAGGLVGSTGVTSLSQKFDKVIGIENNNREVFFGKNASVLNNINDLEDGVKNFENYPINIKNFQDLKTIFAKYREDIKLIIHTAAQPSHDWSKENAIEDFNVNANGTLHLLELFRIFCPNAVFVFMSTNKVYGDSPNNLPLIEKETRYDLDENHPMWNGIDELMTIDKSLHTFFGVSKASADLLTQEYSRFIGLKTGIFRCGCITGKNHKGVKLHGFLSYLVKCAINKECYQINGYKGKQVRDNIHAEDLVNAAYEFYKNPHPGEVYNIGGGRECNCSIMEAIKLIESITKISVKFDYNNLNRIGDHQWWISNTNKFKTHYSNWKLAYNMEKIILNLL